MNIHEYQAKALFETFGVPVPKGVAAKAASEFDAALAQLPEGPTMVKSQIHAGGRGKGTFTDGFKGGVKFCKTKADAKDIAGRMINNTLVTLQTGPAGRKVQTVYFTVASDIKKEYYLAILLDRATSRPVIVASTEGGVEIEEVAHETPEKIFKVFVDPASVSLTSKSANSSPASASPATQAKGAAKLIRNLYTMFWETDASMVRDQPADYDAHGRGAGARRQGLLRRQRPLPPPRDHRPARSQRGGRRRKSRPPNTVSPTSRSTATSPASSTAPVSP
jgi:succinyl-CoA synthetase beta subunit